MIPAFASAFGATLGIAGGFAVLYGFVVGVVAALEWAHR